MPSSTDSPDRGGEGAGHADKASLLPEDRLPELGRQIADLVASQVAGQVLDALSRSMDSLTARLLCEMHRIGTASRHPRSEAGHTMVASLIRGEPTPAARPPEALSRQPSIRLLPESLQRSMAAGHLPTMDDCENYQLRCNMKEWMRSNPKFAAHELSRRDREAGSDSRGKARAGSGRGGRSDGSTPSGQARAGGGPAPKTSGGESSKGQGRWAGILPSWTGTWNSLPPRSTAGDSNASGKSSQGQQPGISSAGDARGAGFVRQVSGGSGDGLLPQTPRTSSSCPPPLHAQPRAQAHQLGSPGIGFGARRAEDGDGDCSSRSSPGSGVHPRSLPTVCRRRFGCFGKGEQGSGASPAGPPQTSIGRGLPLDESSDTSDLTSRSFRSAAIREGRPQFEAEQAGQASLRGAAPASREPHGPGEVARRSLAHLCDEGRACIDLSPPEGEPPSFSEPMHGPGVEDLDNDSDADSLIHLHGAESFRGTPKETLQPGASPNQELGAARALLSGPSDAQAAAVGAALQMEEDDFGETMRSVLWTTFCGSCTRAVFGRVGFVAVMACAFSCTLRQYVDALELSFEDPAVDATTVLARLTDLFISCGALASAPFLCIFARYPLLGQLDSLLVGCGCLDVVRQDQRSGRRNAPYVGGFLAATALRLGAEYGLHTETWPASEIGVHGAAVFRTATFAFSVGVLTAVARLIRAVADIMVAVVDAYGYSAVFGPAGPADLRKDWNKMQAKFKQAAVRCEPCIAVLVVTATLCVMTSLLAPGSASHGQRKDFWVLIFTAPLALVTVSSFARAAEVTARCRRMPSLVSLSDSSTMEADDHFYLVHHISFSDSGFYVRGVVICHSMLVKTGHLMFVAASAVLSRYVISAA